MKNLNFHTDNFECWTVKVGEVVIGNEPIPVYEISVTIKENKIDVVLPYGDDQFNDLKYEQEFLDAFYKQLNEILNEETVSLAFICSDINRYFFGSHVKFESEENPIRGFLQAWSDPTTGYWITWKESLAITEKREKDVTFRTEFEKWALAKFIQLVFGDKSLSFALPRYGSKDTIKTITQYFGEKGFRNGAIDVGKMKAHNFWSKVAGHHHNLYAIWDKERSEFSFKGGKRLTEADLELLHKDLTEKNH
jgi:hypothetical protein